MAGATDSGARGGKGRGFFDPPIGRKTSVLVLKRRLSDDKEDVRIVTSLSTMSSTEMFRIDPRSGSLEFETPIHQFTDEASAVGSLYKQGYVEVIRGCSLLGFIATESMAGVYVAVQTLSKVILPGGHTVQMVTEAQWVMCQLDKSMTCYDDRVVLAEQEFWRLIQQNNVAGTHYFCETVDISRPFPSGKPVCEADQEFVWNYFLTKDFRKLGLRRHCPSLLQGAVESAEHIHVTGQRYTIANISRRSRRHPGTRYLARGLNSFAGPGNEIEVELIVWKNTGSDRNNAGVEWCRHFWRRGTVPIWWGVEIQPLNKGLHAEVYVRDRETYVGSLTYFKSLLTRAASEYFAHDEAASSDHLQKYLSARDSDDAITCINLLHCNPKKAAELLLSSHFQEGVRHVKDRLGQRGGSSLRLLNFDWHGTMSCLSEEKGVEAFWHFIEQPVKSICFASGSMRSSQSSQEQDESPWGAHWKMCWTMHQNGLLRFNCADSLDRTNAASCFTVMPILQQCLEHLGVQLDMVEQSNETKKLHTLPPGWEMRQHGGRVLYIDHNSKRTQWEHPGIAGQMQQGSTKDSFSWRFFSYNLRDIQERLYPTVVQDFVEMFRKHGDVHSELYTGSAAMHSHILGIVLGNDIRSYGSASSVGKLQNLKVAVQRRWNNTISDAPRQQSMEIFLGLNILRHCPALVQCRHLEVEDDDDPVFQTRTIIEDEKEMEEAKSMTHLGTELGALHLTKHDGRLALEEDVSCDVDSKDIYGKNEEDLLGLYDPQDSRKTTSTMKNDKETHDTANSSSSHPPSLL